MNEKQSSPLLAIFGSVLEEVLNRLIALDEATAERIRALEGRALEATWAGPDLKARLWVEGGRLRVGPAAGEPDLGVRATLAGLVNFALGERNGGSLQGGRIQMSGDAELARRLSQLAEKYAPDFEAAFSRALGDTVGPQVARGLAAALAWARESGSTLAEDAADFVREESRDGVASEEFEDFAAEVERARDDADRLAARLARGVARRDRQ